MTNSKKSKKPLQQPLVISRKVTLDYDLAETILCKLIGLIQDMRGNMTEEEYERGSIKQSETYIVKEELKKLLYG